MGPKLFPAGQVQPGALLQSCPMGPFPSLCTGSIVSSFCALSVAQIDTLTGFDDLYRDFLLAPWSLQKEGAHNISV